MPTLHQYPVLMHGFVLQRPSNYCPSNFFDHPPFRTFMIPINYYLEIGNRNYCIVIERLEAQPIDSHSHSILHFTVLFRSEIITEWV